MERKSQQKNTILKVLKGTTSHPTADWIYSEVRKEIPNVSLGTIYRNLRQLKARGKILKLHIDDVSSRFDYNTKSHCHFRCTKCKQVFDLIVPECSKMIEQLSRQRGLQISSYMVTFSGLCVKCQK